MLSFSPTLIEIAINMEIDNGGDSSTMFEIWASKVGNPNAFVKLTDYDGSSTTFTISSSTTYAILAGEIYYMKVRAVNSRGEGEFSQITSVSAVNLPVAPLNL